MTSLPGCCPTPSEALEDHLACCDSCSCLTDQLRSTVADAQILRPDNDLVTTEAYGAVNATLAELDPIDAGLVIDIDGAPFSQAVLELDRYLQSWRPRRCCGAARPPVCTLDDRYRPHVGTLDGGGHE